MAKAVLPPGVRTAAHRLDYMARYITAYKPDRGLLKHIVFPAILADESRRRVLFVGVEFYTVPYLWQFRDREFWTIEPVASKSKYGSRQHHIVDVIENLGDHVPAETFDVIIANGVLNYGVDTPAQAEAMFRACATAMRSGGLLLVGWNPRPGGVQPGELGSLRELFEPTVLEPLGDSSHEVLGHQVHVFNTYVRR